MSGRRARFHSIPRQPVITRKGVTCRSHFGAGHILRYGIGFSVRWCWLEVSFFAQPCCFAIGSRTEVRRVICCSGVPTVFVNPKKRSEEHTSELQSRENLVCRLLLEKKKKQQDV